MEFREKILKEFNVNLPIKGGDGANIESPIIIDISQKYSYVSLEKICINYACRSIQMEWILLKQELIIHEGKYIDVIKIGVSANGDFANIFEATNYFFDISDCFKYSMCIAELNKEW